MRTLLPVVLCGSLAACGAVSTRSLPPEAPAAAGEQRDLAYVVRRGWHVEVGMATTDLQPVLQPVSAAYPGSRYLLFGFGDRRYLLHRDAASTAAALWPGPALMMVTSLYSAQPEDAFGGDRVVRLALTPEQMSSLQSFIARSFAAQDGVPVRVAPGPFEGSAYYEAVQHYSALHTCNTWAAEALKAAELPVGSSGVEFAWQLWHQVQHLASPSSTRSGRLQPGRPRRDAATAPPLGCATHAQRTRAATIRTQNPSAAAVHSANSS